MTPSPASLSGWLISCESKKEILADKIVSFANTKSHYRRRDLWDIPYLLATTPLDDEVVALVAHKLRDYECQFEACELADRAAERIATVLSDGTLSRELSRFLPRALFDNQLGNGGEHLAAETLRAYSKVVEELFGHESEYENEGVEVRPVISDLRNGPQAGPQLSHDQEHADPYR